MFAAFGISYMTRKRHSVMGLPTHRASQYWLQPEGWRQSGVEWPECGSPVRSSRGCFEVVRLRRPSTDVHGRLPTLLSKLLSERRNRAQPFGEIRDFSFKTGGGPSGIRTQDRRIKSPLVTRPRAYISVHARLNLKVIVQIRPPASASVHGRCCQNCCQMDWIRARWPALPSPNCGPPDLRVVSSRS